MRSSSTSSPPGRMCSRKAITLHIVPVGRNSPASWPSSSATRSCRAITVGSAKRCSSPTSAAAIASRIAGRRLGLRVGVEVDELHRAGAYPRMSRARREEPPSRGAATQAPRPAGRLPLPRRQAGACIYVGKAKSIRKRVALALLQAGTQRGPRTWSPQIDRIEFARRRRPRPRRCWPSRTSSSSTSRASTSACATTSPIRTSRSRSTRTSRASTSRASATAATAPTSARTRNAKRVRETLDLLGKVFLFRSCDGPEPGPAQRLALPRLLHQALRGALRRLRLQGGVPRADRRRRSTSSPAATARSSASSRSA